MAGEGGKLHSINENYKIWKSNVPFLYEVLQSFELSSCSQTVEWLPQVEVLSDWRTRSLLLATNSTGKNSVFVASVALPELHARVDHSAYQQQKQRIGAIDYRGVLGLHPLHVTRDIAVPSDVMRARANPQHSNIVAVKTGSHYEVLIYDLEDELAGDNCQSLGGHLREGFALCWNRVNPALLASGSVDTKLFVWDVQQGKNAQVWKMELEEGVEDVKWSNHSSSLLGAGLQSERISLWDVRLGESKPVSTKKAHLGEVTSIDFNRFNEHLLLSGGEDCEVCLWDIRNFSKKVALRTQLTSCACHLEGVTVVQWSPHCPTEFATGAQDRRVCVWDISKIGSDQANEPQELTVRKWTQFIHGGHRTAITDLAWGAENGLIASSESNCILQVWKPTKPLRNEH